MPISFTWLSPLRAGTHAYYSDWRRECTNCLLQRRPHTRKRESTRPIDIGTSASAIIVSARSARGTYPPSYVHIIEGLVVRVPSGCKAPAFFCAQPFAPKQKAMRSLERARDALDRDVCCWPLSSNSPLFCSIARVFQCSTYIWNCVYVEPTKLYLQIFFAGDLFQVWPHNQKAARVNYFYDFNTLVLWFS